MNIIEIPLGRVLAAPYNPAGRDDKDVRHVRELAASISRVGQVVPALVSKEGNRYRLVDGHRRLAALRHLEHSGASPRPRLMAYERRPGEATAEALYAEVNESVRKHSPNEKLRTWLRDPSAVSGYMRGRFASIESEAGREAMRDVADAGMTATAVWPQAKRVAEYCGFSAEDSQLKALYWLIGQRQTRAARTWIDMKRPRAEMCNAVWEGRPLDFGATP